MWENGDSFLKDWGKIRVGNCILLCSGWDRMLLIERRTETRQYLFHYFIDTGPKFFKNRICLLNTIFSIFQFYLVTKRKNMWWLYKKICCRQRPKRIRRESVENLSDDPFDETMCDTLFMFCCYDILCIVWKVLIIYSEVDSWLLVLNNLVHLMFSLMETLPLLPLQYPISGQLFYNGICTV